MRESQALFAIYLLEFSCMKCYSMTMKAEPRKLGRPRGPEHLRYQITLSKEAGEWGKNQPGGLSALVRRLIEQERRRQKVPTD